MSDRMKEIGRKIADSIKKIEKYILMIDSINCGRGNGVGILNNDLPNIIIPARIDSEIVHKNGVSKFAVRTVIITDKTAERLLNDKVIYIRIERF